MKKLLIIIALLSVALGSNAQDQCKMKNNNQHQHQSQGKGHGKKQKMQEMMKSLNLTSEQKAKLKEAGNDSRKKIKALELQQNLTLKEYNDKKTAIRKEMQAKREAILTKEQKDKIASMKSDREKKKDEMYDKKMGKMKEKLGLTDDQARQMNALRQKTKDDINSIKNNNKLNDQEKRTQIKELMRKAKENRMNILTKEQLIKMMENKNKKNTKDKSAIKK